MLLKMQINAINPSLIKNRSAMAKALKMKKCENLSKKIRGP